MTIGSFGIFRLVKSLAKIVGLVLVVKIALVTRVMGDPVHPLARTGIFSRYMHLDSDLNIQAGSDKKTLHEAMRDHVLGAGELMGHYQKRK